VTLTAVLQCAGNGRALHEPRVPGVQWRHGAMGQATWTGVRLKDLLDKAGVAPDARHVRLAGADRAPKPTVPKYLRSIPLARALDPTTLVALRMNGEPLTLAHGAPFRLVVPGWAGDHWIKWLTHLRVQKDEAEGFFMNTAYKLPKTPVAPGAAVPPEQMQALSTIPIKSIIARPADGESSKAGPQEIVGVAFSGEAAIDKVEVRVNDGPFVAAKLEGPSVPFAWRVFRHRFEAKPGKHTAVARAVDVKGVMQPETAVWNPSGYFWNAWHRVEWEVIA
jgi:DMSO/TMAO reductase YedYZ molybdopterin-dependent catalytic subunit